MKLFKLLLTSGALAVQLLFLVPTRAALNSAVIGADSQWLISVDFNELRGSVIGKQLLEVASQSQPSIANGMVQVDFQKLLATVGSITAYGANFAKDPNLIDGALVLQGTPDLRKIAEAYVAQATVTTPDKMVALKDLPFEAYSIGGQVIIAFPSEPIILVSKSKAQLIRAHDVFRGKVASLAKATSSPLTPLLSNTGHPFLVAASVVPSDNVFPEEAPQARILQMAKSGSLTLGEDAGQTFLHVRLVAASAEMADKLMKIVPGLIAMASLAESSDNALGDFLRAVTVTREDTTVNLSLSYASDRLVTMIATARKPAPTRMDRSAALINPPREVAVWNTTEVPAGAANGFVDHTLENVRLSNGSTISLIARRNGTAASGDNARIDSVEIAPAQGSEAPLRFEAEFMRLTSFTVQTAAGASGGKVIGFKGGNGTAQFSFPGEDGTYKIKVRYMPGANPKATVTLTVKDPDPIPALPEQN
jgi:hypothetical protein